MSAFLHAGDRADDSALVDSVIVTVAPTFIGEGIGVVPLVSVWQAELTNRDLI